MLAAASRPQPLRHPPLGHPVPEGHGHLRRRLPRPSPEFDMMMGQMEVSTTMHGGYRDHPDYVESEAMSQIYGYLSEAVAAPPAGGKSCSDYCKHGR